MDNVCPNCGEEIRDNQESRFMNGFNFHIQCKERFFYLEALKRVNLREVGMSMEMVCSQCGKPIVDRVDDWIQDSGKFYHLQEGKWNPDCCYWRHIELEKEVPDTN